MNSLLTKIALHKAVGVCLGDHEISVSKVAFTPTGAVEVSSASEPYTAENLPEVLEKLLVPLLGRKRRVPLVVGLAASKLFYGSRIITGNTEPTAEAMLAKSLCSPTISVDDLTADMLVGNVRKSPVASVVAGRKKYMTGVVAALEKIGVRPVRAEPAPCALVRIAVGQKKYPRRKTALCVFLGATHGLAAIVIGDRPMAWKVFSLQSGNVETAILSAARTLQTQGKNYGVDSEPDYVVVHGNPELQEELKNNEFPSKIGIRVVWQDGPALDDARVAYGLAAGCSQPEHKAFDLSRSLKSRASILEIFPWWDLVYASLLIAWMGMTLFAHSMNLEESLAKARAQSSEHQCLNSPETKDLEKNTKKLEEKVKAVYTYLDSRILWTEFTRDIAERLPDNAELSTFTGEWVLPTGRKKRKPKQSLLIRTIVPQTAGGTTPREIDDFLEQLRNDPLLKKRFGIVELTDIKRSLSRDRKSSVAAFTVICLPKKK